MLVNFNDIKPNLEKQYDISQILELPPAFNSEDNQGITLLFDSRDYENRINASESEKESFTRWSLMRCCELARKSHIGNLKLLCSSRQLNSIKTVWPYIISSVENIDLTVLS